MFQSHESIVSGAIRGLKNKMRGLAALATIFHEPDY